MVGTTGVVVIGMPVVVRFKVVVGLAVVVGGDFVVVGCGAVERQSIGKYIIALQYLNRG